MKIKFITCIYSNLHNTEFGGRPSRGGHYRYGLLSLLKMTSADFLCYTSSDEIEDLKNFFYETHNVSENQLKFRIYNLKDTKLYPIFEKYKDIESVKNGDRCVEIQYSKFDWFWNEDGTYDYYYWVDAGLSHCGIIPDKYLNNNLDYYRRFFESNLFNNDFLNNLINFTNEKFFIITKDNLRNYWSGTVSSKWYNQHCMDLHIIGGIFGGKKELWEEILNLFEKYVISITEEDKIVYSEENIMTLMYYNHTDLFVTKYFETWWHEDNYHSVSGNSISDTERFFSENKSFYKILEELN